MYQINTYFSFNCLNLMQFSIFEQKNIMAEIIKLEEAVTLTHAFQNSEIGNGQTISGIVEKEIILEILNQQNCEGINIYTALNEEGKITFVLVGYDNDNNDITYGKIADRIKLCPDVCPIKTSPLKSS